MSKKKKRSGSERAKRVSYPDDEKKHPWLGLLFDAYHTVDKGVAGLVKAEEGKGRKLACSKGCAECCKINKDIPLYPLELKGIVWYVTKKISADLSTILIRQLEDFSKQDPCPFLVEGTCAIHTVRPMACRQFNVFGSPCTEGEDPYYTRRKDVMDPVKKYVDQAFFIMLPFHGVEKETERRRVVETGSFHKMVRELHACNWKELAEKIKS